MLVHADFINIRVMNVDFDLPVNMICVNSGLGLAGFKQLHELLSKVLP